MSQDRPLSVEVAGETAEQCASRSARFWASSSAEAVSPKLGRSFSKSTSLNCFFDLASHNTDDGIEGLLFQPHRDGGSCQTLPGRPFQRRSRWPTHRHVAWTDKLDTLSTRTFGISHTSPFDGVPSFSRVVLFIVINISCAKCTVDGIWGVVVFNHIGRVDLVKLCRDVLPSQRRST